MPVHGGGPQSRGGALMRQSTPPYAAGPHAPPQSGGGHAHPYFGGAGNNVGQCQHQPSPPSSSSSASSQPLSNQQNQFQGEVGNAGRAASYQHSAIAIGNPTPPLTPATGVPPYAVCSSQAIAAAAADVKPTIIIGGGGDLLKANVAGVHASASCQQPQPQAQPLDSKCAIGDTKPAITNANASEWA